MPRYVILRHELPPASGRASHWDVMLEDRAESGEIVLKTWAIERSPDDGATQPATLLPDHRAAYLTYEGPVSGGRGEVSRWDEGTFSGATSGESLDLRADVIEVMIAGRRLCGRIAFRRRREDELERFEYRYAAEPRDDA
jgi:hypothetical protein